MAGRPCGYDYRIAQIFSNYEIQSGGYHAIAGMSGSFWADAHTLEILEVQVHAVDIPPQLKMRSAVTTITYGSAKLAADRTYLIPAGAVITIVSDTGSEDQPNRFQELPQIYWRSNDHLRLACDDP